MRRVGGRKAGNDILPSRLPLDRRRHEDKASLVIPVAAIAPGELALGSIRVSYAVACVLEQSMNTGGAHGPSLLSGVADRDR